MKNLITPLTKTNNKVSQADYNRIYNLYQEKKSQVTLDGKKAIISCLTTKFPVVSENGNEVEFCFATIERILNSHCQFKS